MHRLLFAAAMLALPALLAACADRLDPTPPAGAERGRQLLAQYHCGSCHTIPGVAAARGTLAVTLEGIGRRSYLAGHVPNGAEQLVQWIVDPASLVPDTTMPRMGVSPEDARDIAAYLRSLR